MKRLSILVALLLSGFSGLPAQQQALSSQERAIAEFHDLTAAMQRLQVALADSAPDDSRALAAGNRFVQERRLVERMAEVGTLLRGARWDEALEAMSSVRADQETLLQLLQNREHDLDKLMADIARLEAYRDRLKALIAEQQKAKERSAEVEAAQQRLQALEQAAKELDDLMRGQAELQKKAEADAEGLASQQTDLQQRTDALAAKLSEIEPKGSADGQPGEGKPSEGKPGEPKGGQPKQGEAGQKKGSGSPSSSCQSASAAMGKAAQKLGGARAPTALQDMQQASRRLQEAKEALQQEMEKARRRLLSLPFEELAGGQEKVQVDTDKLAQDMERNGATEKDPARPAPGAKNVQQAVPKQRSAAGSLKEHRPRDAKQEQQDAKERLEEAQRELEDALAQMRQELQDEVLRALEERFAAMLQAQQRLTADTTALTALVAQSGASSDALPSALARRCDELGTGEQDLVTEAADASKLLEQEGTTAVFPEIVDGLHSDLQQVARRLSDHRTDVATHAQQVAIEDTLKMLIDALRRAVEDSEGNGSCCCNGQPVLVPRSAELKLIVALQKKVSARTADYDTTVPEPERGDESAAAMARDIAKQQGRVEELTRKLAQRIAKDEKEAEQK